MTFNGVILYWFFAIEQTPEAALRSFVHTWYCAAQHLGALSAHEWHLQEHIEVFITVQKVLTVNNNPAERLRCFENELEATQTRAVRARHSGAEQAHF